MKNSPECPTMAPLHVDDTKPQHIPNGITSGHLRVGSYVKTLIYGEYCGYHDDDFSVDVGTIGKVGRLFTKDVKIEFVIDGIGRTVYHTYDNIEELDAETAMMLMLEE